MLSKLFRCMWTYVVLGILIVAFSLGIVLIGDALCTPTIDERIASNRQIAADNKGDQWSLYYLKQLVADLSTKVNEGLGSPDMVREIAQLEAKIEETEIRLGLPRSSFGD